MTKKFTATSVNTPFETLPETSFLVTSTGEAIYDNINVGKLPENWFPNPKTGSLGLDVSKLISPGFIWRARIDYMSKYGAKVLTALLLTAGLSITLTFGVMSLIGGKGSAAKPPSMFEKIMTAPITYFSGNYPKTPEIGVASHRPILDLTNIKWQPRVQLTSADGQSDWVTKAGDLNSLIKMEIDALDKTGKIDPKIPTTPIADIRETWSGLTREVQSTVDANGNTVPAHLEGGKPDVFRIAVTEDNVFLFSIVLAPVEGNRLMWMPWAGVIHKANGKWSYKNLVIPNIPLYQVQGFDSVPASDIPFAMAKAFPTLVRTELSAQPLK